MYESNNNIDNNSNMTHVLDKKYIAEHDKIEYYIMAA